MEVDEVWEIFGEYWVVWCLRSGFDLMISALGSSVSEFLSNLDFLHSVYLSTTYPQMTVPSFRVENLKDGTIVLHYYSQRSGLNGIVVGIVKAVASIIFDVVVEMEITDWRCEIEGGKKEHTTFLVKIKDGSVEDDADIVPSMRTDFTMYMTECPLRRLSRVSLMTHGSTSSVNKNQPLYQKEELNCPEKVMVDPQTFCKCFPYHVVFDGNLVIRQCGAKLQRLCPDLKQNDCRLDDFIVIKHPQISLNVASIRKFINMIFLVEVKVDKLEAAYRKIPNLSLRGQMVWMEELKCIIFLSSPRLISLQDLQDHNMHFSDIAPHDVTRDLILFNEQRGAEIELAKQLEEKKEELRILMQSLREEKMKTDALLYSMLPRQVANDLREGRHVEAGEFDAVTVLFADIVKFTDMCAKCKPIQIVNLLNVMYGKFDRLTNVHDVYKVRKPACSAFTAT
ncbi:guanylate cyclase soluble subunit beta-2-like [Ptychodera flava]|uniref:guanylate cyclase soluble subunit beta-2-like n=1 Tax=Ptychodera flava TaxID=63121 RepID=UPI00396A1E64